MLPTKFVGGFVILMCVVFGVVGLGCLASWLLGLKNARREEKERQKNFELENTWVDQTDICGHRTYLRAKINVFGQDYYITMPFNQNKGVDYCHSCVAKGARLCVRCKEPIFPGAPISFERYHPNMGQVEQILLDHHEPFVLGCTRYYCVDRQEEAFRGYLRVGGIRLVTGEEVPFTLIMK